jgi:hypothetical protein
MGYNMSRFSYHKFVRGIDGFGGGTSELFYHQTDLVAGGIFFSPTPTPANANANPLAYLHVIDRSNPPCDPINHAEG